MRVLISGGGTGGHIYPALAVARQLQQEYQADILYLGSDDGLETRLVPEAGLRLAVIQAGKLQRYLSWRTVIGVVRVPLGIAQAVGIVRGFRPDVAFTSGGYVSVPAGLAARLAGASLMMHQQDVPPNLANRLLAPLATCISVAFADSLQYFPAAKSVQLGNPIRQAVLDVRDMTVERACARLNLATNLPLLLVTGGSQGARHLNQVVARSLPQLLSFCQVLHISGARLYEETRERTEQELSGMNDDYRRRYRLVPYMDEEMPLALQAATLVLCRSGASTLSELATLGKPGVLVPLPPSLGRSPQVANASMFERAGAASVIQDMQLEPKLLVERIQSIITSTSTIDHMARSAQSLAKPDATDAIVTKLVELVRGQTTPGAKATNHEGVCI